MPQHVIQALSFRHQVQPGEPAIGVASRLAALNGTTMPELLRAVGITPYKLDQGKEEAIRGVAMLAGADPEPLLRFSHRHTARKYYLTIAGETFGHKRVHRTVFNYCPHCIAEDLEAFAGPAASRPWLRLDWIIDHIRVCDRHGTELVQTTPARGRFQPFDFSQEIRKHLPRLPELTRAPAHPRPSPYQDWIRRRVITGRDPSFWLDQFPLFVAAPWCEALGVSALHPPKVGTSAFTRRTWADAAEEGFSIASQGAPGIEALLERLNGEQKQTRGFWGLRDTYGYAYGLLQNSVEDPAFEPLRELVRSFADRTIPIEPGFSVLGKIIAEPATVSVRTAARLSGAHDRSVRRLFERQGLASEALEDGLRNHRVIASREALADIVVKLRDAMTAPEVIKALDIPRPHLNALIAVGALPTVTGSEKQAHAKHRFAPSDVDAMLTWMLDGAVPVATPGPGQMTVTEARHAAVTSVENVLGMIFGGKLKWKGRIAGKEGMDRYNALLVDIDEIVALVRAEPPMKHLRRQDVPEFIPGLSTKGIDFFVDEGLLGVDEEFSPEARRVVPVITRESAELFRANFVTLGELRQTSGLHPKQIKLLLKANNIAPMYEPNPAYRRGELDPMAYVYDRRAIDAATAGDADFWFYDKAKAQAAARRCLGS